MGSTVRGLRIWVSIMAVGLPLAVAPAAWGAVAGIAAGAAEGAVTIEDPNQFVSRHLDAFDRQLQDLKRQYEKCCGSLLLGVSVNDIGQVAKNLPAPATLRYFVTLRVPERKPIEQVRAAPGDEYLLSSASFWTDQPRWSPFALRRLPGDERLMVAADPLTAAVLRLPQEIELQLAGDIVSTTLPPAGQDFSRLLGTVCCVEASGSACTRYAVLPWISGGYFSQLLQHMNVLDMKITASPGVEGIAGWQVARFTSPGLKRIVAESPRKYDYRESYTVYQSCVPQLSGGESRVRMGYRPAGTLTASLTLLAVSVKKFGFPGLDLDASSGPAPSLDYFVRPGAEPDIPYGTRITPMVLLDLGDAGGLRAFPATEELGLTMALTTVNPGPITLHPSGTFRYDSGIGVTRFRASLGRELSVEHGLSVNAVEWDLDPKLRDSQVSAGNSYRIALRVKGGADMSRYQVTWAGGDVKWAATATGFRRSGDIWESEAQFSYRTEGPIELGETGQFKITADITRTTDSAVVFRDEKTLYRGYPVIDGLAIWATRGQEAPWKVAEPVDLFVVGGEASSLRLLPYATLVNGQVHPLSLVAPHARFEATSSNPAVARLVVSSLPEPPGLALDSIGPPGVVKVGFRTGGELAQALEFTKDREEVAATPVTVNVDRAILTVVEEQRGRKTYKLSVTGPTNMAAYRAEWVGAGTTEFTREGEDRYAARFSTAARLEKVRIRKGAEVAAELDARADAALTARVQLLPIELPMTTVKRTTPADMGSLETLTECKRRITFSMQAFGFDPGKTVQEYCREDRATQKQEIAAQRAEQKKLNQLLRDLERQGQELVVFGDTAKVGAAVRLTAAVKLPGPVFCRWSLLNGAALRVEHSVTPVEWISASDGACLNRILGLQGGFDPEAELQVDLTVIFPRGEVKVGGDRLTNYADVLSPAEDPRGGGRR